MIDWLDVIGATNIVASLASGYFGSDVLYFRPKMKHTLLARDEATAKAERAKQTLEELKLTQAEIQRQIDAFNQRTREEDRKRQIRERLYQDTLSIPLEQPKEQHGTVRDYLKGCRCHSCLEALRRHGLAARVHSSARTDVVTWGGGVVKTIYDTYCSFAEYEGLSTGVLQKSIGDVTTRYPVNDPSPKRAEQDERDRSWIDFEEHRR